MINLMRQYVYLTGTTKIFEKCLTKEDDKNELQGGEKGELVQRDEK